MKQTSPDEFEAACQFDEFLRSNQAKNQVSIHGDLYLHSSCKPLRDVDFKMDKKNPNSPFLLEMMNSEKKCGGDGGFSCFS